MIIVDILNIIQTVQDPRLTRYEKPINRRAKIMGFHNNTIIIILLGILNLFFVCILLST